MDTSSNEVVTIIHNNLESTTFVNGFEAPMTYQRNITYFASRKHIESIKKDVYRCEQFFEFECSYAAAFDQSYWTAFTGHLHPYDYPDPDLPCRCRMQKACDDGRQT